MEFVELEARAVAGTHVARADITNHDCLSATWSVVHLEWPPRAQLPAGISSPRTFAANKQRASCVFQGPGAAPQATPLLEVEVSEPRTTSFFTARRARPRRTRGPGVGLNTWKQRPHRNWQCWTLNMPNTKKCFQEMVPEVTEPKFYLAF